MLLVVLLRKQPTARVLAAGHPCVPAIPIVFYWAPQEIWHVCFAVWCWILWKASAEGFHVK